MSIAIAGERSGSGKTTVTLALLAALRARNQPVQSFKVGPDYIDPMFHAYVTDRPCYNLDPVLTSPAYLPQCFARHTQDQPMAVVEGVMGLFDGAMEPPGAGSTAQVAKMLGLPVLLVVNCQSMSHSIAALVKGYVTLDPDVDMAGVVLNRVGSDRHLEILRTALEPIGIPIMGVFRREDAISLPDRHLGLVPTDELPELRSIIDRLAALGQSCFDWDKLTPLLPAPQVACRVPPALPPQVRIAVARDAAFNFYYAENLELLETMGAELIYWSPLQDIQVPAEAQGLYFGGGFPEVFAAQLAANPTMRQSVAAKIAIGTPTYAECGGLMFLSQSVTDFAGQSHPMVGVLPTAAVMGQRLTLGYRYATALAQTPLLAAGETVRGHEFHRSTLTIESADPLFTGLGNGEGWHQPHLHASYLHLHWGNNPHWVQRWIELCLQSNVHPHRPLADRPQ
jgi:cobyrinic acid a,c-diamide synthase